MRSLRPFLAVAALAVSLFSQQLISQTQPPPNQQNPAGTSASKPKQDQPKCTDNGTYVNRQGQTVQRPENCSGPPRGATAQCRDGSYSFSRSRRGTCSHHGGVAKWF
jgi:hypothetical protein